jgi:hypothetical protein
LNNHPGRAHRAAPQGRAVRRNCVDGMKKQRSHGLAATSGSFSAGLASERLTMMGGASVTTSDEDRPRTAPVAPAQQALCCCADPRRSAGIKLRPVRSRWHDHFSAIASAGAAGRAGSGRCFSGYRRTADDGIVRGARHPLRRLRRRKVSLSVVNLSYDLLRNCTILIEMCPICVYN